MPYGIHNNSNTSTLLFLNIKWKNKTLIDVYKIKTSIFWVLVYSCINEFRICNNNNFPRTKMVLGVGGDQLKYLVFSSVNIDCSCMG